VEAARCLDKCGSGLQLTVTWSWEDNAPSKVPSRTPQGLEPMEEVDQQGSRAFMRTCCEQTADKIFHIQRLSLFVWVKINSSLVN
jgi:hypothetical protein